MNTHIDTLNPCPQTFNGVRMDTIAFIFVGRRIDLFPFVIIPQCAVCAVLVCMNSCARQDPVQHLLVSCCPFCVLYMNRHCLTIFPFFPHSESNRFTSCSATRIQLFGFMFVLFFPTDGGFINFNDTRQKIIIIVFVAKSVSYSSRCKIHASGVANFCVNATKLSCFAIIHPLVHS